MTAAPGKHVVVVDGSNLATEGRTTPSLRQLDEAVRAYAQEDPGAEIVVVVDASFEHRIDPSERQQLIDAELHGEIVSPPAGAIGRGDAFVLRIAERTGAGVLSNDSFQEFHAEHPWLFDTGRLVGGKPVPGVGWIFTPRVPVRGPKSRHADGKAKRKEAEVLSPPVKAAELAKAAKKIAARKAPAAILQGGSKPKVGDVWPPAASAGERTPALAAKKSAKTATPQGSGPKGAKAKVEKVKPAEKRAKQRAGKAAPGVGAAAGAKKAARIAGAIPAAPKKKVAKEVPVPPVSKKADKKAAPADTKAIEKEAPVAMAVQATGPSGKNAAARKAAARKAAAKTTPQKKVDAKKAGAAPTKKSASTKSAAAKKAAPDRQDLAAKKASLTPAGANGAVTAKSARRTTAKNPAVQEAIGHALAEAIGPPAEVSEDGKAGRGDEKRKKQDGKGGRNRRRRSASPPPAVNEPFAFITFVASYPLDSELEGEVMSFTSHGAMVDVDLPGGGVLHSYIPLTAMGDPPPTKARQVLTRGERRPFLLVALDPPRRVAELALPEHSVAHGRSGR